MELWNKISKPPLTALKKIEAGRLRGKSDINPQWRYQAMTEVFGPCGFGWKFTVDRKWTEPAPGGQVFAFADVSLYVKIDDVWSEAIPGNGGSMLIELESKGLHASDEAYKMAITDALGTAMKMIGMAAEIYLGNFDGSKYLSDKEPRNEKEPENKEPEVKDQSPSEIPCCIAEVSEIASKSGKTGATSWTRYGIKTSTGVWFNTFSKSFSDIASEAKSTGKMVSIYYQETEKGKTIEAISIVE